MSLFQTYNNLEETKLIILRLVAGVLIVTLVTRVGNFQVGAAFTTSFSTPLLIFLFSLFFFLEITKLFQRKNMKAKTCREKSVKQNRTNDFYFNSNTAT